MSTRASADEQGSSEAVPAGGGWYGWVVFAATMLILLGIFHAIAGLVALFDDEYFLVTQSGLVVSADYTAWGWIHILIGALLALTGAALFNGATWARVVAVIMASLSAITNIGFLSAYPLWVVIMITVDILVIYAVTVHGGRQTMERY